VQPRATPSSNGGSSVAIELSHAAAEILASLRPAEAQRVAASLQALRRKDWPAANGTSARDFIEAKAGGYRVVYRFDRDRIRVALLARMSDSRPREMPRLKLQDDLD
jgi:mRNA-degrading endonuclease RelE of RelBE toxin-antitoxin system